LVDAAQWEWFMCAAATAATELVGSIVADACLVTVVA
jgi:hypothetical protein